MIKPKEPANKSNVYSAGSITAICFVRQFEMVPTFRCTTFRAPDRSIARPSGLSERLDFGVNDFRRTTSMTVIVALISDLSESQYPESMLRCKRHVRRFPKPRCRLSRRVENKRDLVRLDGKSPEPPSGNQHCKSRERWGVVHYISTTEITVKSLLFGRCDGDFV